MKDLFNTIKERGYVYQATNEERIRQLLDEQSISFYLGIDPTADSLHIGHFFALMMFRYLQDGGHRGILLIGGATAQIGDPSGKSDMRRMLSKKDIKHNVDEIKRLAARFVRLDGDNPAIIVDNADWMSKKNYIDFMREVGIHFNVNKMLAADAYANRIKEGGLTFLEMGYMLMQAYDFVHLNQTYGCTLQIGGSDQWGNIVAGVTLNRKMNFVDENESFAKDIFGLTAPLLMTKDGKKMGKTEQGTLWVARDRTTPYDFYQYFYNIGDENTEPLLKLFTRIGLAEINALCKGDILTAKRKMAYEITKLVHGAEEADKVLEAVSGLFGESRNLDNAPSFALGKAQFGAGLPLTDIIVISGFLPSKGEARRMITQGAVSVNGEKIEALDRKITPNDFNDGFLLIKKGKKNFIKITLE
ncbi:MAG: tyrosine--tRNA ligase [Clostridiales bacterium]|jgi:tyrosyl-tRNA synthetase|nr:tyrosine--tRNA ligase [Clostridiales bacterium]